MMWNRFPHHWPFAREVQQSILSQKFAPQLLPSHQLYQSHHSKTLRSIHHFQDVYLGYASWIPTTIFLVMPWHLQLVLLWCGLCRSWYHWKWSYNGSIQCCRWRLSRHHDSFRVPEYAIHNLINKLYQLLVWCHQHDETCKTTSHPCIMWF